MDIGIAEDTGTKAGSEVGTDTSDIMIILSLHLKEPAPLSSCGHQLVLIVMYLSAARSFSRGPPGTQADGAQTHAQFVEQPIEPGR